MEGQRVAKPEWGMKRTCFDCGAKFYDLRRDPIICPNCSKVFDPERQPRVRRGSSVVREEVTVGAARSKDKLAVVAGAVEEELVGEEAADADPLEEAAEGEGELEEIASEDEALIEDTSDLGEDDDDIGEVMEHVDDDIEEKP
ncbi:MAG: TIGR02300 family protein [Defluviicoccus sp.]